MLDRDRDLRSELPRDPEIHIVNRATTPIGNTDDEAERTLSLPARHGNYHTGLLR